MMAEDLNRLQAGDGSKFNSSIADLERIHLLLVSSNQASISHSYPLWIGSLRALDREISPYLNREEEEDLTKYRVTGIPTDKRASVMICKRLDDYERRLRYYRSKKKLGIVAEDDASTAAMR